MIGEKRRPYFRLPFVAVTVFVVARSRWTQPKETPATCHQPQSPQVR
jgi:hypothetical protein